MTDERVPLDAALATPDSKRRYVRKLFSTIADRYDLITGLLSFGLDKHWKRRAISLADPKPNQRALDLACGTGDLTFGLAALGARVVGLDITHRMLLLGRARSKPRTHPPSPTPHPLFIQGDMTDLPFGSAQFDLVTTGYGLRNVPDLRRAVREIQRVLRPGGVFVSLDFNRPSNPGVCTMYLGYLWLVGGALGWVLHGDPDTYRYIPASIRRYPGAQAVVALMQDEGFAHAKWMRVLGGLMAIHVARR